MRAVIQRVSRASVTVDGEIVGAIDAGLCVLVGVGHGDDEKSAQWLAEKTVGLRVFEDEHGKMNRALEDIGGQLLAVSQFTLYGDVRKGRRPSFTAAMEPKRAESLFEDFCTGVRERGVPVETGTFQTHMEVSIVNDGPVTILLDSDRLF